MPLELDVTAREFSHAAEASNSSGLQATRWTRVDRR
jgi:hypothetical protein